MRTESSDVPPWGRAVPRQRARAGLDFRILGPVEVVKDGAVVGLDGCKQRTVLAALLLAEGRVLSDSRLCDLLWGDRPPNTFGAQIYTYVSRLRRYLGPPVDIRRQPPGYAIDIGGSRLDLREFEQLTRQGREALEQGSYQRAADLLHAAMACWRGPALANVTEFLTDAESYRLEEARMAALESRIEADLALGRHPQLVPELTALVNEHPLREQLRANLMTALYRLGRQSDALLAYHEARRILAEEVGADPGAGLYEVYQAVLNRDPRLLYPSTVPLVEGGPRPRPVRPPEVLLPADLPDFTGRAGESDRLKRSLLADASGPAVPDRLPVVSGMAGVGKTALAIHVAHAVRHHFPDGLLYADLGGTTAQPAGPVEVLGSFLRALGVDRTHLPAGGQARAQLFRSLLVGQRMLVVLDDAANEEQLRPLLPDTPGCRAVATSRHRLATLAGANLIDLDVLAPRDARALLARVAGADRVDAEPGDAGRIADQCGRLPLALRIAGARLAARPYWPLSRLADRLDDEPRRLGNLSLGAMDVRESIRPSYERAGERARTALHGLSLLNVPDFPAWTVAAVLGASSAVGEEVAEALTDARLLEPGLPDQHERPRYRFHELVRLFAKEMATRSPEPAASTELAAVAVSA